MKSHKPVVRWTIGSVSNKGFKCLCMAIKAFRSLYGDSFDYNVLYNSRPKPDFNFPFVKLVDQGEHLASLPYKPWDCCWKLYPPRLNFDAPEIYMDNDLILHKRIREIDILIESGIPFMTEALGRNYGRYDSQVKQGIILNCGFFGFPEKFDFAAAIAKVCKNDVKKKWVNHFDDQGLVAAVMCRFPEFNTLPRSRLAIVRQHERCPKNKEGYHFVHLNKKNSPHLGWDTYTNRVNLIKI